MMTMNAVAISGVDRTKGSMIIIVQPILIQFGIMIHICILLKNQNNNFLWNFWTYFQTMWNLGCLEIALGNALLGI